VNIAGQLGMGGERDNVLVLWVDQQVSAFQMLGLLVNFTCVVWADSPACLQGALPACKLITAAEQGWHLLI